MNCPYCGKEIMVIGWMPSENESCQIEFGCNNEECDGFGVSITINFFGEIGLIERKAFMSSLLHTRKKKLQDKLKRILDEMERLGTDPETINEEIEVLQLYLNKIKTACC